MKIKTTCPYCGVGCGIVMTRNENEKYGFTALGDDSHSANFGRLCVKGSSVAHTLSLEDRLKNPVLDGKDVSWDVAIKYVAKSLRETISKYGKNSIAFYVSGQFLTEDYYVANKFIKGFLGTSNIDTNSRLCMSSAVAGYKRAFGEDLVPSSYEDFDYADLIVLVGSNTAYSHPIVYQRIKKAKVDNPKLKIISIDPRATATNEIVDLHLQIRAGSDGFLFNSLLGYIYDNDLLDNDFIKTSTNDFESAINELKKYDYSLEQTSKDCDIRLEDLEEFINLFILSEKTTTLYSQGINQSSSGVDKSNAIINVHLATGKIGKKGSSPFSITGQPNAMGGREVGGLANQLASHMDFNDDDIDRVSRFWGSDNMAREDGLKAVNMFEAIEKGDIKCIWIMHTNPAVSMPDSSKIKNALEKCPIVISSDIIKNTDSNKYANILLPALSWGEKDGTVTNSDRTISRQRAFLDNSAFINAKADWEIIKEVACEMGFEKEFNYKNPYEVFIEHCKLSAFENEVPSKKHPSHRLRAFNLSALSDLTIQEYNDFTPTQWPIIDKNKKSKRLFEDGKFFTKNHKANFISIIPEPPFNTPSSKYPLVFNTGRLRDLWHTMGRTAKTHKLLSHTSEPYLYLNEKDIIKYKLNENQLINAYNELGSITLRAKQDNKLKAGNCFAPIHWNNIYSSNCAVNTLIPSIVDPISGQPEFKHSAIAIKPSDINLQGFLYSDKKIEKKILDKFDFWVEVKSLHNFRYEIGLKDEIIDFKNFILDLDISPKDKELFYIDETMRDYRYSNMRQDNLKIVLFLNKNYNNLPSREYLGSLFDDKTFQKLLKKQAKNNIIMGYDSKQEDNGAIICSCFGVGEKTIKRAIKEHNLKSVSEISKLLKAGTNCGSCLPELKEFF